MCAMHMLCKTGKFCLKWQTHISFLAAYVSEKSKHTFIIFFR